MALRTSERDTELKMGFESALPMFFPQMPSKVYLVPTAATKSVKKQNLSKFEDLIGF